MSYQRLDPASAYAIPPFAGRPDLGCFDADPKIFFPTHGRDTAQEAKRVCRRCCVRDECLDWALDTGQSHGVWGATTPEERRTLLTGRRTA